MRNFFRNIRWQWILLLSGIFLALYFLLGSHVKNLCPKPKLEEQPQIDWGEPSETMDILLAELGQPDLLNHKAGGSARWTEASLKIRGKCWTGITLYDSKNQGFLLGEYAVSLPEESSRIIPNSSYDSETQILSIKANSYHALIVLAKVATLLAQGKISGAEVYDTLASYDQKINPNSSQYDPLFERKLVGDLCAYHNSQIIPGEN